MEEKKAVPMAHNMEIKGRALCNLTGITDVLSFDEKEVLLDTSMGMLQIRGDKLHVKLLSLENGKVEIEGTCNSFIYQGESTGRKPGDSILKRLFR